MHVPGEGAASSSLSGSSEHAVRFGEVRLAINHRSETQARGDTHYIEEIVSLYNRSPLGSCSESSGDPVSVSSLAMKYLGMHGDHAEDQKAKHCLLVRWMLRS